MLTLSCKLDLCWLDLCTSLEKISKEKEKEFVPSLIEDCDSCQPCVNDAAIHWQFVLAAQLMQCHHAALSHAIVQNAIVANASLRDLH